MRKKKPKKDDQVTEVIGRDFLISELFIAKFEVAIPARDRGIDLIIYKDRVKFAACPIQMKAASERSFSIDKRHRKIPSLIMAYVWNVKDPQKTVTYALTYKDAVEIAKKKDWTDSDSWKHKGRYAVTRPNPNLLEAYKMDKEKWERLFKTALRSASGTS